MPVKRIVRRVMVPRRPRDKHPNISFRERARMRISFARRISYPTTRVDTAGGVVNTLRT